MSRRGKKQTRRCRSCGAVLETKPAGLFHKGADWDPADCDACSSKSRHRRAAAGAVLPQIAWRAEQYGILVTAHDQRHLHISFARDDWSLSVYPGTCRLRWNGSGRMPGPAFLPAEWTLRDVLESLLDENYADRAVEEAACRVGLGPAVIE